MKTLLILRHGKAEIQDFGQDDYERALTSRGVKNAKDMGKFIAEKSEKPDLILSSSAKRAYQTAVFAAEKMEYPVDNIQTERGLYLVPEYRLLKFLSAIPAHYQRCMLVGHNPGLTDLVNYFGVRLDNLPTASVVCFTFDIDSWEKIADSQAKFQWIKLAREL